LDQLRRWRVSLRSFSESWLDTSGENPVSDLIFNILASVAQFERSLIASRVKAGLQRARKEGKILGRPRLNLNGSWEKVRARISAGELSYRAAASELGIGRSSVARLMQKEGVA